MRLKPQHVWITGAAGFSGRHLARYLREIDGKFELTGIGRHEAEISDLDSFHAIDLTDAGALCALVAEKAPDRVFHLAGAAPPAVDAELWQANVGGTQTLLQSLAIEGKSGVRIVTIGSAAEYYPLRRNLRESDACGGESTYGRTKWAQTMIALACGKASQLDVMVARTFNLLGPGLPPRLVAGALCRQFAQPGTVKVGETGAIRDFVDVRDAVRAYWQISEKGRRGSIYNVATGRGTSIQKLVDLFVMHAGGDDRRVERLAAKKRPGDYPRAVGDSTRLRRLGWRPSISVERSIRDMLEFARNE